MASGENSLTSSVAESESFLLLISCAMTIQLKRNQPIIRAIKKKDGRSVAKSNQQTSRQHPKGCSNDRDHITAIV